MGCTSSRESHHSQLLHLGANSTESGLTAAELRQALELVASHIDSRGASIVIVAVGGAVSTLFLRSRHVTHDLDYFNELLSRREYGLLRTGAEYAADCLGLEPEWMTNRTVLFLPSEQREGLSERAIKQNEVIFQAQGLTVVAAPWIYAFLSKLHRISGKARVPVRRYDPEDAAEYLDLVLEKNGFTSVSVDDLKFQASLLDMRVNMEALKLVAAVYYERFNRHVITY